MQGCMWWREGSSERESECERERESKGLGGSVRGLEGLVREHGACEPWKGPTRQGHALIKINRLTFSGYLLGLVNCLLWLLGLRRRGRLLMLCGRRRRGLRRGGMRGLLRGR